jgi:hypothetical protein
LRQRRETTVTKEQHVGRRNFLERRQELEAYRESQYELARCANDPDRAPVKKAIARVLRELEKKKTFAR